MVFLNCHQGAICVVAKKTSVLSMRKRLCLLDLWKHFPEDPIGSVAHPAHIEYKKNEFHFITFFVLLFYKLGGVWATLNYT